ncbi:MAG: hypothetical protein IKV85_02205 [Ruminococcus sp.]|nr:hypothetical protein [Ruminococcus sp.]
MKKITNEYFKKFCDVIERSLTDSSKIKDCLTDIINASKDDSGDEEVYKDKEYNIEVLKLDEYTKDFKEKRKLENTDFSNHQPPAVDAVCVNKNNEWFLIEFKNQKLKEAIKDTPKKMHSSIWLIAYLYSKLSENLSDEKDLLKFARENITFITVVSSEKNEDDEEAIGVKWEKDGSFYTPLKFKKYKGYYFKDIYVLTEKGLRFFVKSFED